MKSQNTVYHVQILAEGKPQPVGVKKDKDSEPQPAIYAIHEKANQIIKYFKKQHPDKQFRIVKVTTTVLEFPWQ